MNLQFMKRRPAEAGASPTSDHLQWAFRMLALLAVLLNGSMMFGQAIEVAGTSVKDGDELSTISELTIQFNFDEAAKSLNMEASSLGIACLSSDFISERLLLYKGDKTSDYIGTVQDIEDEHIVGYGYKTIAKKKIVAGQHEITIPFNIPIELESG